MKLEALDALNDDELQAVIARSGELLKLRDEDRKDKAMVKAKAILAEAGLTLSDIAGKGRGRASKAPAYKGGSNYQHPTKKGLMWNAKGQKPTWLRELEAQGVKAVLLPESVSDAVPLKKAI